MAQGKTSHFKLVLLGDTAVGKSCLVVRFVRDEFFEFQEPTIGGACVCVCASERVKRGSLWLFAAAGSVDVDGHAGVC